MLHLELAIVVAIIQQSVFSVKIISFCNKVNPAGIGMEPTIGIEPTTLSLRMKCSTI